MRLPFELWRGRTAAYKSSSDSDATDIVNQATRDSLVRAVNSLEMLQPNEAMVEEARVRNTFNMTSGEYGGGVLVRQDSNIYGTSGGSIINTKLTLNSRHIIDGVRFKNSVDSRLELVEIGTSAIVQFRNCIFDRTVSGNAPQWVIVGTGGLAVFVGCMFLGDGTGGAIISHAGAAANVQVVGSYNGTGIAFAGVTWLALGNI